MKCPKCNCDNVKIDTNSTVITQSRSFIWNLFMIFCTAGFWVLWMLIRKKKTTVVSYTICTCQNCGHNWRLN